MKLSSSRQRKKARLEIIPLIDIMFFLVATFMMVSLSLIKNEGIDVNLPLASNSNEIKREQSVTISIDADNALFFNKEEVSLDDLKAKVVEFKGNNPQGPILMNCDRDSNMGKYIEVLDALRIMGISNVSLQTKLPPG